MDFRKLSRMLLPSGSVVLAVLWLSVGTAFAQDLTAREKRDIKAISRLIDRAGKDFKNQRFDDSARRITQAIEQTEALLQQPRAELLEGIEEDYQKLQTARRMLTEQGQDLPELGALPSAMAEGETGDAISFKSTVAPILLAKCGNCHVSRNRGQFSAASHAALLDSTMIATGKPDDSRLIEVIENGEMPKGGLTVTPDELASLKNWIAQGAKFDGDAPSQNLTALTGAQPQPRDRDTMMVRRPTGKETVSFGLDVAPVLIENCGRCHRLQRNPRGNFSMVSFRTLLRGGDGGNPIVPTDSSSSHLIQRLRGDGAEVMPPSGKLPDEIIDKIAKWIDEGAVFDGTDARADLAVVSARVKANSLSHEDLLKDRKELAGQTWKLVMGDIEGQSVISDNLLVYGSVKDDRLEEISKVAEAMAMEVADAWRLPENEPLVKGNVSMFVFPRRYDFGEFGRMVEKRDFPREISSHWNYTIVDAYTALLMTRNQEANELEVPITQQLAALYLASRSQDTPRWFVDGVGLWTAKKVHSRNEQLADLDQRAEAAAKAMTRIDDFVQNRMNADQSGLVAYLFIKQLRSGSSAKFNQLIGDLIAGQPFEASFANAYGAPPANLLRRLTGGR